MSVTVIQVLNNAALLACYGVVIVIMCDFI